MPQAVIGCDLAPRSHGCLSPYARSRHERPVSMHRAELPVIGDLSAPDTPSPFPVGHAALKLSDRDRITLLFQFAASAPPPKRRGAFSIDPDAGLEQDPDPLCEGTQRVGGEHSEAGAQNRHHVGCDHRRLYACRAVACGCCCTGARAGNRSPRLFRQSDLLQQCRTDCPRIGR